MKFIIKENKEINLKEFDNLKDAQEELERLTKEQEKEGIYLSERFSIGIED